MDEYETLNHTTWDCKYHLVFMKYRRKVLYQELRKPLGEVFPHPRLGPRYSDSAPPDPCRGDRRSLPKCGASRGGVIACCSQGPGNRRQRRAEHPQIWRKTLWRMAISRLRDRRLHFSAAGHAVRGSAQRDWRLRSICDEGPLNA